MTTQLLFLNLGGPELLVIFLVILLLFGGKKVPELMKGLGKGVKSFKDGMNEVEKDIREDATESATKNNNEKKQESSELKENENKLQK